MSENLINILFKKKKNTVGVVCLAQGHVAPSRRQSLNL